MTIKESTNSIIHALSYGHEFSGATFVIKLGGSIIHNNESIDSICSDLKVLQSSGVNIVLVHGGGKAITEQLLKENIHSEFVDGLRVTSKEAMKVIEMVLCGQVNLMLVKKLNLAGVKSIGLSGADDSMLACEAYSQFHMQVGRIKAVNTKAIDLILNNNQSSEQIIPVVAPIGVNDQGDSFNINADYAACSIANSLKADKLIYLTDQEGIYDQQGKIISEVSVAGLEQLISNKTVEGGMLTKAKTIIAALNGCLKQVHILSGNKQHALLNEIFTEKGVGTLCSDLISDINKEINKLESVS